MGRTFSEINKIQFREVENYLRDANHRPSIGKGFVSSPSFDSLKEGVIEQILTTGYKIRENNKLSGSCETKFEHLTLAKKLGELENFIYHRVSPYLSEWHLSFDLI